MDHADGYHDYIFNLLGGHGNQFSPLAGPFAGKPGGP